jgi:hypothetical protein
MKNQIQNLFVALAFLAIGIRRLLSFFENKSGRSNLGVRSRRHQFLFGHPHDQPAQFFPAVQIIMI